MPTIFIVDGYRGFFFSNEGTEPVHVHIEKGGRYAKFWIHPVALAKNSRFNSAELNKIRKIISKRKKEIQEKWNDYFNVH